MFYDDVSLDSPAAAGPFDPSALRFLGAEPGEGQRWSTWTTVAPLQRGPRPHPDWVVTSAGAFDTELGVVKSGKEADLFLIERAVPDDPTQSCILAAKRYRSADNSDFHRSARYTEGRGMRNARDTRAVARGTTYGRTVAAGTWANAEFEALCTLHGIGLPVPYPVQVNGTEILMEFISADAHGARSSRAVAAPRLAQVRTSRQELRGYLDQVVEILITLADAGFAHGDLSPYNLLVRDGRIIVIDLPQLVEVVSNPSGLDFLHRDCVNVCAWFTRHGLETDPEPIFADLITRVF